MMKKQNKKANKNIIDKINNWFVEPQSKIEKSLPAGKMIVDTLHYDTVASVAIASVLINMTIFITWLLVVADPAIRVVVLR